MTQWKSGEWADVPSAMPVVQPVNTKLSVVLPFIQSEVSDVEKLLEQSFELSGQIRRRLFLLPSKGVELGVTSYIKTRAETAFEIVLIIPDAEGINSDWQGRDQMRSASGPNSLFRQAAWFFYLHKEYGSWLWLEPDCWPQTARWFYDLEREHFEVGKPFTGVKMQISPDKFYMNGVGIYPWNAVQYAPSLVQATMWKQHPEFEVGFDVSGGDVVLNHAHITKLIQLTNHLSKEKVELRPETVLTHGRINLSGPKGDVAPSRGSLAESGLVVGTPEAAPAQNTLPVPVLAESLQASDVEPGNTTHTRSGEARESTIPIQAEGSEETSGPRDGQNTLEADRMTVPVGKSEGHKSTAASTTFLGAYGAVRDVRTEASDESRSHPRPDCLSSHETRTQEPTMDTEPKFQDGASFSDQIRFHINRLSELQSGQLYRRNRIVSELRKAKLIPRARKNDTNSRKI